MNLPRDVGAIEVMRHTDGHVCVLGSDYATYSCFPDGDCRQITKKGEFVGMTNQWLASFFLVDDGGDWRRDALATALAERFDHVG